MLLESRGSLIVRRLCVLLGAERVFREMAAILMEEANVEFASACHAASPMVRRRSPSLLRRRHDPGAQPHTAHRRRGASMSRAAVGDPDVELCRHRLPTYALH